MYGSFDFFYIFYIFCFTIRHLVVINFSNFITEIIIKLTTIKKFISLITFTKFYISNIILFIYISL